ncbi:MAG: NAD-binding protein [Acidimicrobiia bacterium]|nr:NAD-binding protein [Acidimicrobiia bacterium]MDH3396492.1 NAD-binding protein [Acidimicrobiia bacterium]MDH5615022.1 NAD-binding protein [Acidimicrobiia bacterium]
MRIVIAGSGRVGGDLAHELADHGHDVSVVDISKTALEGLGSTFNGSVHLGLAYDVGVLKEAGIEYADAFVAVTDSDNANLMAVQLAKEVFMVPKTIARLDDPHRERAYRELDVAYVAASRLISKVVYEQVVEQEFRFHVTFEDGETEIVDMQLGPAAADLRVMDLEIDDRLRVAAVRRDGRTFIPDEKFHLKEGDLVVAAARKGVLNKVRRYLVAGED